MAITIDMTNLPRHVAIIMDGNGRWAQARGLNRIEGHKVGAESVRSVTEAARELGIGYLTLYAFSTENWQRPRLEVEGLMRLLNRYLKGELREMLKNGIRLNTIGHTDHLPKATQKILRETMAETADNKDMVLTLALSYGGRSEILQACQKAMEDCRSGLMNPEELDEAAFASRLFTTGLPDPDLMIRTGGDQRISNFLLWQLAYSELYVTPKAWPDFKEAELKAAIIDYQQRQRRFGKTGDQVKQDQTTERKNAS